MGNASTGGAGGSTTHRSGYTRYNNVNIIPCPGPLSDRKNQGDGNILRIRAMATRGHSPNRFHRRSDGELLIRSPSISRHHCRKTLSSMQFARRRILLSISVFAEHPGRKAFIA